MLPVSLRFNISMVHLFLFTLIPKHTPKEEKKILIGADFFHVNHSNGSPDHQLTTGALMESRIHNCFKQYLFSYSSHGIRVSLLQPFLKLFLKPPL